MKYLIEFLKWYESYCLVDCNIDDLTDIPIVYSTFDTDDGDEHEVAMSIDLVTLTETIRSCNLAPSKPCGEITIKKQYECYEDLFKENENSTWDDQYDYAVGRIRKYLDDEQEVSTFLKNVLNAKYHGLSMAEDAIMLNNKTCNGDIVLVDSSRTYIKKGDDKWVFEANGTEWLIDTECLLTHLTALQDAEIVYRRNCHVTL